MPKKDPDDYKTGHRKRLRDRFNKVGLEGFQDYEIVELLLTLGTPRKDVEPMAREAIARFKTLSGVLNAPVESLTKITGIGEVAVFVIKFVRALTERIAQDNTVPKQLLNSPEVLFKYIKQTLNYRTRECFAAIMLDAKNKVIQTEVIFEGSLTSTCVYPREVIAVALRYNAASVIFAHNHPSGDPTPSQEDTILTRKLVKACTLTGIIVHDHMIIGDQQYYSFAEEGLIHPMKSRKELC